MASFLRKYSEHYRNHSNEDKKINFYIPPRDHLLKDNYESTLISNTSDIINLIEPNKLELPIQEFIEYVKDLMKEYKTKKIQTDEDYTDHEEEIPMTPYRKNNKHKTQKYKINKFLEHNRSILNGSSDLSLLKVNIKKQMFKNPYESLDIINENAKIYTNISSHYIERQQHYYNRAYEKVHRYIKNKIKMPKVKVTNIIRPIDLIRQDVKEEKKTSEVGKVKLYDLSNPFIVEKQCPKLFCSYTYTTKNFPEGREQFAFIFNGEDIVLYSGLSSSRNNLVWTLNAGKFY
jgi:hypothetical protein